MRWHAEHDRDDRDGLAGIVAVLWYIYAAVRLVFFLPAVVVAEEQIGLGRSWALGRGNFWRIIIVIAGDLHSGAIAVRQLGAVLRRHDVRP